MNLDFGVSVVCFPGKKSNHLTIWLLIAIIDNFYGSIFYFFLHSDLAAVGVWGMKAKLQLGISVLSLF